MKIYALAAFCAFFASGASAVDVNSFPNSYVDAYMKSVLDDASKFYGRDVALKKISTIDQKSMMQKSFDLQEKIPELYKSLGESSVGGAFIDESELDRVKLLIYIKNAKNKDFKILEKIIGRENFRVWDAQYSIEEIKKISSALDEKLSTGTYKNIIGYFYNFQNETFIFHTYDGSSIDINDLIKSDKLFQSIKFLFEKSQKVEMAQGLFLGGTPINGFPGENRPVCTAGFNVTGAGFPFMITAGHCIRDQNAIPVDQWHSPYSAVFFGTASKPTYRAGVATDYAIVGNDYWKHTQEGAIWASGAVSNNSFYTTALFKIKVNGTYNIPFGTFPRLCKQGRITGYRCGIVNNGSMSVNSPVGPMSNMIEINVCTAHGDSGGPVLFGDRAVGIISSKNAPDCGASFGGGVTPRTYVVPINVILNAYGVQLL